MEAFFLKIFLVMLGIAVVCAAIARAKNRNPIVWFLWGLALGVFALGYIIVLPEE